MVSFFDSNVVVVGGLLVVGFLHEQKEKKKIKQRGGQTVGSWGAEERRDKVEQGAAAPHVHFHSLEVILRRYLFNFSV